LIFLLLKFSKEKKKTIAVGITSTIILGTLIRVWLLNRYSYHSIEDFQKYVREPLIMRMDSIIYGILGAFLNHYKFSIWSNKNLFFGIGIVLCVICSINYNLFAVNWFTKYAYLSIGSIAVLMLLPKLNSIKTGKGITFKTLTFISVISYSIYLLNMTPFNLLTEKLNLHGLTGWILFIVWSFGASYLLNRWIEKPFMALRDKGRDKKINKIGEDNELCPIPQGKM
jgi:peptidoglycan/LPS O-acetylase OafA/YrhL